ncbi:VOC family protein [Paenibacillus aurantiacus]|uniref:VOC family protein n=1 Tax=Paenibacillus aurantiacus TaxID=1936118 RepID=A0ABV5KSU0_9BACL
MKMAHVRLLVPHVPACFSFYRDIIGLQVRHGDPTTPYAEFQTGDISLAFEPLKDGEIVQQTSADHDRVVLIFTVENVDAAYERLRSSGVAFEKEPHDTPEWGHRVAYFRDPAGNLIELNQGI